jgi:predicted MFS family arabinose efflux permease
VRRTAPALLIVALVVAAVGSLGAPLITSVATTFHVSLAAAQWTLTITLLTGVVATPVLGRLGAGKHRRGTVLATLGVVVVGSALTVLPLPFAWLLVGRGAQGVGLGLTALMIGIARDHLPAERAATTIALVSVASTVGIGIGYPLAGLLADIGGVRAAYGFGLAVTALALLVAAVAIPAAPPRSAAPVDVAGAVLLAGGLTALLVVASETRLWRTDVPAAVGLVVVAIGLLVAWWAVERRVATPLVDLRLLRQPTVAAANVAMLAGGIGMYLLLTLVTRYAQTPRSAGYGFGLSTFAAGLVLVPFSALGFVAGRAVPRVRAPATRVLGGAAVVVLVAFIVFGVARSSLAGLVVAMAALGLGVGAFSAAMPAVILRTTPPSETSSAMGVNQVVRGTGFSLGSAIGGLVLAAATATGRLFPADTGYTTATWVGIAVMAVTATVSVAVPDDRGPEPGT